MSFTADDWSPIDSPNAQPTAGGAGGFTHRRQLIVDADAWDEVRAALTACHAAPESFEKAYGLVRATLAGDYESVMYQDRLVADLQRRFDGDAPAGRNRVVAHTVLEFDDPDVEGTPKVLPSARGRERVAPAHDLPNGLTIAKGDPAPGMGMRVGVVDTLMARHSLLDGATIYEVAPLAALLKSEDEVGEATAHSTFVASLIRQQAPGAIIQVEAAIDPDGVGDIVAVHDAICRLVEWKVDVINLSLGCVTADNQMPFVFEHALGWAKKNDLPMPIFVASAGNGGTETPFWPAADGANRVWSVGGAKRTNDGWELAPYSGRGSWVRVAAPSDQVAGAYPHLSVGAYADYDRYAYGVGTSFATATISGLAACTPDHFRAGSFSANVLPAIQIKNVADEIPLYATDDVDFKP